MMRVNVKAFYIHLLVSLFFAFFALFLVFNSWYPAPLHLALGVTHIFLLLIMVDMILGPVLTLIVYKSGKKTLIFDLTVIAVLQLSALAYGLWIVAEGRPAWLVFNVDRFDVVQVVDIDQRNLELASLEYQTPPWFGPKWVGADRSASAEQSNIILFESIFGGPDIAQRPSLYRPLNEFAAAVRNRAQPIERLTDFNDAEVVAEILARWPEASGWLPLMARVQPMVVLLEKGDTKVLGIVPLHPWK